MKMGIEASALYRRIRKELGFLVFNPMGFIIWARFYYEAWCFMNGVFGTTSLL
jgi:hypothetical protein